MKTEPRLASARSWLATLKGVKPTDIARRYRKRYGVDCPTALRELTLLGFTFDPAWVDQLSRSLEGHQKARARRSAERKLRKAAAESDDSDETFAFIAGYTSGGFAYGITWEESARMEAEEQHSPGEDQDDVPF